MTNWSAIDSGSTIGKILRAPLRLIPRETILTIRSGAAAGLKWKVGAGDHGCWLGTYELQKQRAWVNFLRPSMTVYDIGAQAGFYSLVSARAVGPAGRVYSFEPCPYECRFLLDNVKANRLPNIRVIQAAVSASSGFAGITVDKDQTQNSLCALEDTLLSVPVLCLDQIEIPPPDLIKMDVEGAESDVLIGGRTLIKTKRPVIFVALHGTEQIEKCSVILRQYDYKLFYLDGSPVDRLPLSDEIYAVPNSLC